VLPRIRRSGKNRVAADNPGVFFKTGGKTGKNQPKSANKTLQRFYAVLLCIVN